VATVTKHRGRWVADYRDQHNTRRIEVPEGHFENLAQEKKAAEALLARRLAEITRGDYKPYSRRPSFDTLCADYLQSKVKIRATTRRDYEGLIDLYLVPYFEHWKVDAIGASDVERFRADMAEGVPPPVLKAIVRRLAKAKPELSQARAKQQAARNKPGIRTINKCLVLLFMTFKYAMRKRWVKRNPAEDIDKLPMPFNGEESLIDLNILTPAEVKVLLAAAEAPHRDRDGKVISNNYRLLIKAAIHTGMRQGELLGLQWGDIDWNSRQVHVRRAWKEGVYVLPKTKKSRRVELTASLIEYSGPS
jgi:integrase